MNKTAIITIVITIVVAVFCGSAVVKAGKDLKAEHKAKIERQLEGL